MKKKAKKEEPEIMDGQPRFPKKKFGSKKKVANLKKGKVY